MIHQAFWLEYLTLAWMTIEVAVAVASGIAANSLTLVAFGIEHYRARFGRNFSLAPYGRTPARTDVRRQRGAKSIAYQRCFAVRPCHLRCRKRLLEALDTPRRGVLAARPHPMHARHTDNVFPFSPRLRRNPLDALVHHFLDFHRNSPFEKISSRQIGSYSGCQVRCIVDAYMLMALGSTAFIFL